MSDFCHPDAPQDLQVAVRDVSKVQQWVKDKTIEDLLAGLDFIYVHHVMQRSIIQDAIAQLRHRQIDEHFAALRSPHWTVVPTFWLVIIGIGISICAAAISWIAWREPFQPLGVASSSASTSLDLASPSPQTSSADPIHASTQSGVGQVPPLTSVESQPPAKSEEDSANAVPATKPEPPATPVPKQP